MKAWRVYCLFVCFMTTACVVIDLNQAVLDLGTLAFAFIALVALHEALFGDKRHDSTPRPRH